MRSWRAVRDGLPATMLCPPDDFPLARSDFKKTKQKKTAYRNNFAAWVHTRTALFAQMRTTS